MRRICPNIERRMEYSGSGLHVSTVKGKGYMGASPDGLVCYGGEIQGCIEIKCPYSARDKSSEACSMSVLKMKMTK